MMVASAPAPRMVRFPVLQTVRQYRWTPRRIDGVHAGGKDDRVVQPVGI